MMKKRMIPFLLALALTASMAAGCGSGSSAAQDTGSAAAQSGSAQAEQGAQALADGVYSASFNTDSSMFHVNEAKEGKGELTVKDGQMTIHVDLVSKNIVNLFVGTAEDAQKDGAQLLEPVTDTVTYSDGYEEEVYGFDIPVPAIGEDFAVALVGTKGTWYDHTVSVTDPEPLEDADSSSAAPDDSAAAETPKDGKYTAEVTLEGGSGRAFVESPAKLTVKDGKITARIEWSSPYYDYMLVDGEEYDPVNKDGNSVFAIPISALDTPIDVTADTTRMSKPHEIDYTLTVDSSTLEKR